MIFDTDVIIWFMRGKPEAAQVVASSPKESRFISIITYMELIQGIRDKAELKILKKMLPQAALTVLPLSEHIGNLASDLMDNYKLSAGLEVQDALIAATAVAHQDTLYTGNVKHFKGLGVDIKIFSV
ncbi:MAG TPA: VapC toxin family PIN domain ribonuclease [Desulfobulbaceae bacterium]|nr:VapC toxin family PIN domain ribonuclease [Desulfobulbaceae bacterium]